MVYAAMRIPASVRLPFGYVVRVRQVTDTEMAAEAECDIAEAPDGLWDDDVRTIWIRKSLPPKRARYILYHEIGHVLWDAQHALLNEGALKP